ncbi:hypothetical protein NS226_16800 [Aureimonas ureilytica]|uniref:Pirin n=1 Tax=Aureimonas ureilytica TaxID=401562 RepID=A0A175R7F3_9HYPH|nr:replication protein RepA [Aureimonas ureilytica]KTQ89467.1 hypothetical protein NS226_16800 [Aureimonas ureilytica]
MDESDQPNNLTELKRPRRKQVVLSNMAEAAAAIYGESAMERGDLGFLHTLHANCYLPRGATKERRYVHGNGPFSIMIDAGALLDPKTRKWVDQPLPSGGKPRALLAYINTYAVRHKTPVVPLGRSLSEFVGIMSGETSGGAKGSLRLWKTQMMALAACNIRIAGGPEGGARTEKVDIIKSLDLWLTPKADQFSLFPTELKLTTDYMEALQSHAMPVDMAALRALQHDPLAFDVFVWLVGRLPRVRQSNGVRITWEMLFDQFGGGYSELRFFKRRFTAALKKAKAFYPSAKIELSAAGLLAKTSDPMVKRVTSVASLDRIRKSVA